MRKLQDLYTALPLEGYQPPRLPEPDAALEMAVTDLVAEESLVPALRSVSTIISRGHDGSVMSTPGSKDDARSGELSKGTGNWPPKNVNAVNQRVTAQYQERLRQKVRRELHRPTAPKQTPVATALRRLAGQPETPLQYLAEGVAIIASPGAPLPELLTRDGAPVALRLSSTTIAPVQALPGCTTVAYLDAGMPTRALLALDWRPPDVTALEREETLQLLISLADNLLLPRAVPRAAGGVSAPELVRRRPMAALVHAFLANAAGDRNGVEAFSTLFLETYGAVPYDLAMLAGDAQPVVRLGDCPQFSAGWRLLEMEDGKRPLVPGLLALTRRTVRGFPFAMFADSAVPEFLSAIGGIER